MINRKIEYFITLAECLSFTQTASRFAVSQTAISQYIASLEERLELRLFERSQHTVKLTEAGRIYYQHVKQALQDYEGMLDKARAMDASYHGYLRVGIGQYEYCSMEHFFSRFLTAYPDVKLDIMQYPYSVLTEKLRTGELDVIIGDALCEDAFGRTELKRRQMFVSPNYLVADPGLTEKLGTEDPAELLRKVCLITNCEADGPSSMQMLRGLLMDEFGFLPAMISQTNSINTQLMLVRAKQGVAIVPGFVYNAQGSGLKALPLPSKKQIVYELLMPVGNTNEAAQLLFDFQA